MVRVSGRCAALVAICLAASGCTYDYGFSDRASYPTLRDAKELSAREKGPVAIAWDPSSFPDRIDVIGPSSEEGAATKARIPTGRAIATRVDELMDEAVGVDPRSDNLLTITVVEAETTYAYAVGFIAQRHINHASCVAELEFAHGSARWTERFTAAVRGGKDPADPAGTELLEMVWDDVALQATRSAVRNLPAYAARPVRSTPVAATPTPVMAPPASVVAAPDRPIDGTAARPVPPPTTDADLERVIAAWPDLPEPVRAGITAMVEAAMREKR